MIFLTGSTGFLGREVLGRLLIAHPDREVCVLVRAGRKGPPEQRVSELVTSVFGPDHAPGYLPRVRCVAGDLSQRNFGLTALEFAELAERVSSIYHCAASTSLSDSLKVSRQANVAGTREVIQLARIAQRLSGRAASLFHVSTAYVAGDRQDVVLPDELLDSRAHSFRNAYEASKAEAERLVRSVAGELPTCIFRPSMIVGDSVTGETPSFNVIYIPARYLVQGLVSILPGRPNTPLDIVPVDYVADAIVALSGSQFSSGVCYHLCSGVGRESSLREIIELIAMAINEYSRRGLALFKHPQIVPPEMIHLAQASLGLLKQIWHLLPYMARNPRFDVSLTEQALFGRLAPAPLFTEYAQRVFEYCFDTNWGRTSWTNPAARQTWVTRALVST